MQNSIKFNKDSTKGHKNEEYQEKSMTCHNGPHQNIRDIFFWVFRNFTDQKFHNF